ncbi:MAG: hypothetical protein J5867_03810 [Prevotella sp.]|nr:hypothetical protein [Prevotella sp.]
MAMYIMGGNPYFEEGIAPRQRRVYLMRWNPSISGFTREDFDDYFKYFKGVTKSIENPDIVWTIWDWKEVMHRDLFVMMQVGQEQNGIVWGGFLNGAPYQYRDEKGKLTRSHFIECTVMYMHRIEKTNILSAERLMKEIPEVDWLHGHAGELLSTEVAEKLGLLLVDELRKVNDCNDVFFDTYNQKLYVLADILTFMCPDLKKRLLAMGKCNDKKLKDINEMMVKPNDEDYFHWDKIEEHLSLEKLNGLLM